MKRILLFASGGGSNVEAILNYFSTKEGFVFPAIVTNNANAGVISKAETRSMDVMLVNRSIFYSPTFLDLLDSYNPDLLVLAGFLWKLPEYLVKSYENKILNIHPSLLPKYGGKGMYGHHVHEAVIENKEKESGITIHLVNEHYDDGKILLQKTLEVLKGETAERLASRVLSLEHEWYPKVIESYLMEWSESHE